MADQLIIPSTFQLKGKSALHCCLPLCNSDSRYDNAIHFHKIPKDTALKKQWIIKIRRDEGEHFKASSKPLVVGAIDFGTTYSGWAFSFLYEFQSDPTKATVKQWNSGVMTTEKTPTCVLIGPDKKLLAFGYEAENRYKDLAERKIHKTHYYFRRFKMMLNKKLGERLDRHITLEDEMGKSLPAILVFSMAVKYLVQDMLKVAEDRQTGTLKESDIHWVLTVPAIWTDAAKQFMRLAAYEAGIDDSRLTIALEPEAASIYCRHLSVETTVNRSNVSISQFKAGTRYVILDAGGGTIDITVHEVTTAGQVKEVQSASGGGWGGILVDKAFEDLIVDIFTRDVYVSFKKNETEDWLDMWRDFEVKKRSVTPDETSRTVMKLPASLKDIFRESTGNNFKEAIAKSRYAKEIGLDRDKLKFEANLFRCLFDESLRKTISHVRSILRNVHVEAILMVGGFSESPLLQNAVKKAFAGNGISFVIPLGASSTILRGALIFGHSPKSVTERVLKYTYGIKTLDPFEEGIHPEKHRFETETEIFCRNIFSKHVEMNQTVTVGEPQVIEAYSPIRKYQRFTTFQIYASTLKNPKYVDEGCTYVGELTIEISDPDDDLKRETEVSLTFSGTEIEVEAYDKKSGAEYSTKIDFFG